MEGIAYQAKHAKINTYIYKEIHHLMLNQKLTHERFVEFLQNATLSDIETLSPENLPDNIQLDVLFEAPMELSESVRSLVLKAQALQAKNEEGDMLKTLGQEGQDILDAANGPTPSPIQQAFRKQQKAAQALKEKLAVSKDPVAEKILNKVLAQLAHGASQIQSQKNKTGQYLNVIRAILKNEDQSHLHSSAKHIEGKLEKQLKSLNKDIANVGQAQAMAVEDQIQKLITKIKNIYLTAAPLQEHTSTENKKTLALEPNVKNGINTSIENIKAISHTNIISTVNELLSDLSIDPNTQDINILKKMDIAFSLTQWFCAANEMIIQLESRAKLSGKENNFISDQLAKQHAILNNFEKSLRSTRHFYISAIQAKEAWTQQLKIAC